MAFGNGASLYDELHEKIEHWRQRAEAAEAALKGDLWDTPVNPLTLQETRIMRLIARNPQGIDPRRAFDVLSLEYGFEHPHHVKVVASKLRRKLPAHIAPRRRKPGQYNAMTPLTVPDRTALLAFLGEPLDAPG